MMTKSDGLDRLTISRLRARICSIESEIQDSLRVIDNALLMQPEGYYREVLMVIRRDVANRLDVWLEADKENL